MARKPARMYRQIKGRSYTRREYMGGVPNLRIQQFNVANTKGDFPIVISLRVREPVQIRHTALEAARITINRSLQKEIGQLNYHLKILTYPHEVLRENKMATGAGADRISSGMRKSFGKPVGTAARVRKGQAVLIIRTQPQHFNAVKKALRKGAMKFPSPCYIEIERGKDLIKAI